MEAENDLMPKAAKDSRLRILASVFLPGAESASMFCVQAAPLTSAFSSTASQVSLSGSWPTSFGVWV